MQKSVADQAVKGRVLRRSEGLRDRAPGALLGRFAQTTLYAVV